jgi:hypothetical protein
MSYRVAAIDIHKKVLMVVVATAAEEVRIPTAKRWSWSAGKPVWVRNCEGEVEIRYGGQRIARHRQAARTHGIVTQPEHHEGIGS